MDEKIAVHCGFCQTPMIEAHRVVKRERISTKTSYGFSETLRGVWFCRNCGFEKSRPFQEGSKDGICLDDGNRRELIDFDLTQS